MVGSMLGCDDLWFPPPGDRLALLGNRLTITNNLLQLAQSETIAAVNGEGEMKRHKKNVRTR
jgi:hypothetical protein